MRVVTGLCLLLAATNSLAGERKEVKKATPAKPANGIRTPGVQIPFDSLASELTSTAASNQLTIDLRRPFRRSNISCVLE